MPTPSRSQIIQSEPIGGGLDDFRSFFSSAYGDVGISETTRVLGQVGSKETKACLVALIYALQALPACHHLPSTRSRTSLREDLSRFMTAVFDDDVDIERLLPLLQAILQKEPDRIIWDRVYDALTKSTPPPRPALPFQQTPLSNNTGSFANSTEYRKHIDLVLKEELGYMYTGVPGYFEAFFEIVPGLRPAAQAVFDKCKEGESPLYQVETGWQGWPEGAKEKDVLSWFVPLIGRLLDLAEGHRPASKVQRRLYAQPNEPLQGSTVDRKLDVGFVDDPDAGVDSKSRWSQILIPGELKSNPSADKASKTWLDLGRYAREVFAAQDSRRYVLGFTLCGSLMRLWTFDRLGGIASQQFDINEDGLQFVSAMLGFLWMNEEQMGFDPTIITIGDRRYIEIEQENTKERLVIDKVVKRVRCVAGRATTCWKVHRENDPGTPLVVKDSWQYPEREEEGELLKAAKKKGVVNVARYFHHQTVRVGGQDDEICKNVRKGLDIMQATNYKPEKPMPPPSTSGRRASQGDANNSVAGQKRSTSSTPMTLPPRKRTCPDPPTEPTIANRVHRRVIVCDYGKPIYKASSQISLLAAFEKCIDGYESLHTRGGMLQRDISPNNLMVNEDDENPSWPAFLIDLDFAIKEQRVESSGARGKTGTRVFMAIGVLLNEQHSFMHDLESFFWVLFWICIHYDGPGNSIGTTEYECWNYENDQKLAGSKKSVVDDDSDFLQLIQKHFTPYYQSLIPYVKILKRKVFPDRQRWKVPNLQLYDDMKQILQLAQNELKDIEE